VTPDDSETAAAITERVRSRLASATETVAAAIARAEQTNPRLNAVAIPLYDTAPAAARRLDGDRIATRRLPLAGVPVSVKESIDVAGTPSSGGVEALARDLATDDGRIATALRAAGAVPIAKGNLAQLAWFAETENPVYGRTSNPHALDRSPGGSSGGDAALVAAGVVPVAIGTDLGGSVRQPAHCCGIAALKPTEGRLSLAGSLDERLFAAFPWIVGQPGILARDPADLAPVLAALDAGAAAAPAPPVTPAPTHGLRVGVIATNGIVDPAPAVRRAVELAAAAVDQAGAHVVAFEPPAAGHALDLFDEVFLSDGGASIELALAGTAAHPRVAAALAAARGHALDRAAGDALAGRLAAYRRRFAAALDAERLDAILGPVYPVPAVPHGTSQDVVHGQSYASLWNLLGYPAGVVPVAADPAGLPVAAQVAARPWREDVVLGLIAAISTCEAPPRHIADR